MWTSLLILQKFPVQLLTNNVLFPNNGITTVKQGMKTLSGLDSLSMVEASLFLIPL
jgi:hypothetical protein